MGEPLTDERIAELLNLFPEVEWDRYVDGGGQLCAFGWIDRDDGRHDFLCLTFYPEEGLVSFGPTSSARYSREFMERLHGTADGHFDCQRVEGRFGGLVPSCVRLGRPGASESPFEVPQMQQVGRVEKRGGDPQANGPPPTSPPD